jgi:hypothetical protein
MTYESSCTLQQARHSFQTAVVLRWLRSGANTTQSLLGFGWCLGYRWASLDLYVDAAGANYKPARIFEGFFGDCSGAIPPSPLSRTRIYIVLYRFFDVRLSAKKIINMHLRRVLMLTMLCASFARFVSLHCNCKYVLCGTHCHRKTDWPVRRRPYPVNYLASAAAKHLAILLQTHAHPARVSNAQENVKLETLFQTIVPVTMPSEWHSLSGAGL